MRQKSPVICLHGFPGLPAHWNAFAAALPDDRAVHSVAMPWLRDTNAPIGSFADILTYVARIVTAANLGPAHFVGHDLGGVALYWLARSGFGSAIKTVTLIAAPHPQTYNAFMSSDQYTQTSRYIDAILTVRHEADLTLTLNADVTGTDCAILADIEAGRAATDFSVIRSLYAELRLSAADVAGRASVNPDCPVALIHSTGDRYLPATLMADSVTRFGAHATAFTLDGDSHYPHLTASMRVAEYAEGFWNDAEA